MNGPLKSPMRRFACLFVPLFSLAARLRSEPQLAGEAVAVCEGNGSAARVNAAARAARRAGVRAGMTLAQARSVLPGLVARGRDSGCESSAHEALQEVAWSLSPRIEDAAEDLIFADVSGMGRLFPGREGEHDLGHSAIIRAQQLQLPLRLGIAANKLAAQVAARMPDSPTVVPGGHEAAFLAPLPLTLLGLDRRLIETLRRWGITTIGELAKLPADEVASRLGPAGLQAHQAARGTDPKPLVPHQPPPTLNEGMELEWPVVIVEPLLFALRQSLERMAKRLAQQDLTCAQLELELGLESAGWDRRTIRLPAPTKDVEALVDLIRLNLETCPAKAPVTSFVCVIHPNRPRPGQLTLFGPPEIDPEKLATTLARLVVRLGPDRVGSPRTADGHRPERFQNTDFSPPPAPKLRRPPHQGRGLLMVRVLRPAVALEVISEIPEEVPTAPQPITPPEQPGLRLISVASVTGATPRIQGLVRVAAGPWNLEDGWWSEEPVERDYWDVELSGGELYRIYRDRTSREWFADGIYD